jgi:hypothetical protein
LRHVPTFFAQNHIGRAQIQGTGRLSTYCSQPVAKHDLNPKYGLQKNYNHTGAKDLVEKKKNAVFNGISCAHKFNIPTYN